MSYAIVETGGKQLRVEPGKTVRVEKLAAAEGDTITFDRVIAVSNGGNFQIGTPLVEGASVKGTVVEQGKYRKIIVYKYKNKTNYRRKHGHRQPFTAVKIESING